MLKLAKLTNNSKSTIETIKKAIMSGLSEVGVTETASIKSCTPVKTGNLKRSIEYTKPVLKDNKVEIKIGTDVTYAAKVEFENKSYLRATLKADTKEIQNVLIKHLRSVNK